MDEIGYILWEPCGTCEGETELLYSDWPYNDYDDDPELYWLYPYDYWEHYAECWRCKGDGGRPADAAQEKEAAG